MYWIPLPNNQELIQTQVKDFQENKVQISRAIDLVKPLKIARIYLKSKISSRKSPITIIKSSTMSVAVLSGNKICFLKYQILLAKAQNILLLLVQIEQLNRHWFKDFQLLNLLGREEMSKLKRKETTMIYKRSYSWKMGR